MKNCQKTLENDIECNIGGAMIRGNFFLYNMIYSSFQGLLLTLMNIINKIKKIEPDNLKINFLEIKISCEVSIKFWIGIVNTIKMVL